MTRNTHPNAHPDDPHFVSRSNWLRAAVLGANDGIVSTSSLIVGVAAAGSDSFAIAVAGFAGLSAGALSMAAGEYVSVSSQSDTERADIRREAAALRNDPETELDELVQIYEERGLSAQTARIVARELTAHDALGAHLRDELGLSDIHAAKPLQAAMASAATFSVAGAMPLAAAMLAPAAHVIPVVLVATLIALAALGAIGARAGGAPMARAVVRVLVWGVLAMGATALIGRLMGVSLA